MKKFLIILILCLILCGCNKSISNEEMLKNMKDNEYIIIDVRTKEEYQESHIVGAINIPYDEIDKTIKLDKNKTIFVYCRSGSRSEVAFNKLNNLGYEVYDLGSVSKIDLPKE